MKNEIEKAAEKDAESRFLAMKLYVDTTRSQKTGSTKNPKDIKSLGFFIVGALHYLAGGWYPPLRGLPIKHIKHMVRLCAFSGALF